MSKQKRSFISELFQLNHKPLVRFLMRRSMTHEDAQDIASEAVVKMMSMSQDAAELDNARAYLYQTAENIALDKLRRAKVHHRYETEMVTADANEDSDCASPDRKVEAEERVAALYQSLDNMPSRWREALMLKRMHHLSNTAIAEQMGVSLSSVEKYLAQGLRHIRMLSELD